MRLMCGLVPGLVDEADVWPVARPVDEDDVWHVARPVDEADV
jgi:hypothetical protein